MTVSAEKTTEAESTWLIDVELRLHIEPRYATPIVPPLKSWSEKSMKLSMSPNTVSSAFLFENPAYERNDDNRHAVLTSLAAQGFAPPHSVSQLLET